MTDNGFVNRVRPQTGTSTLKREGYKTGILAYNSRTKIMNNVTNRVAVNHDFWIKLAG